MSLKHLPGTPSRAKRQGLVLALSLVLILTVVGAFALVADRAGTTRGEESSGSPSSTRSERCTVDKRLVNGCRAWFGGTANHYPEAEKWNKLDQTLNFERRLGRRVDVVHSYHVAGDNELSKADIHFAKRPQTLLLTNWQPAMNWRAASGSSRRVNAGIDQMARSIKSLGRTRIFLAVFHEPENDVSTAPDCSDDVPVVGSSGTADDYRAMWRNVRTRFDAIGVDNVVWVMNFMGYHGFDCMVDALYPGDALVDWILFNAYDQGDDDVDFAEEVRPFYRYLSENSRPGHDYKSKVWGLAEWGIYDSSQESAYRYYGQAREALEKDEFPRLKMYLVFDSVDLNRGDGSYRVAFDVHGRRDPDEQRAFNEFANSPAIAGPWTSVR